VRQTLQHTLGAIVLYGLFWGTKQAAFLGLATPGPVYKGLAAFFSFYVEAGLLICIFFCGQVSFLGLHAISGLADSEASKDQQWLKLGQQNWKQVYAEEVL
jgi:hypothetical protein